MIICLQVNIFYLELSNYRYITPKGPLYDLLQRYDNHLIKDTDFCLLACGGHPLSPPINSPDNIAHIKGITYLSDYGAIMVCLGGAKKRAINY